MSIIFAIWLWLLMIWWLSVSTLILILVARHQTRRPRVDETQVGASPDDRRRPADARPGGRIPIRARGYLYPRSMASGCIGFATMRLRAGFDDSEMIRPQLQSQRLETEWFWWGAVLCRSPPDCLLVIFASMDVCPC